MRWGNVNFDLNSFTVTGGEQGTKNYESRTVPMFPALEDFLRQLHDTLPSPPSQADFIFSIDSAKKALATCCRKAGLPSFTHHSLRHFFCSNAIEAGVDFKAIAGWLGHKDGGLLVARTYGHLRDEHSAAMAKRMTFSAAESEESLKNIVAFSPAAGS
jgi:integrase